MRRLNAHIAALCLLMGYLQYSYAQPLSDFTTDSESWGSVCSGGCSAPVIAWSSVNGNPTGCIKGTDVSTGTWYFYTPAEFNGDNSAYYGCNLKYDLKQNTTTFQFNDIDVMIIRTDDSCIVYDTPYNPGTTWTSYTVPLSETGWKHTTLAGSSVTAAEMLNYLGNVKRIRIRAEYAGLTYETDWLDNAQISCDPIILPVELDYFNGLETESNIAQLNWSTLTEKDCLGFQIEKSSNNGLVYDSIGYVVGNGTTNISHDYSFTDDNLSSISYYRLKQIDVNQSITYSKTIIIEPKEGERLTSTVYPNPATQQIFVESDSKTKKFKSVEISDIYGNVLLHDTSILQNLLNRATINISNLPTGMYYITITSDLGNESLPLQIIH